MTLNLIGIALWGLLLGTTLATPDRPFRPFWLVLETVMLVALTWWAARYHTAKVEKARQQMPWRTR